MTINPTTSFTGTVVPSIPMRGVGTRVILESSIPIFIMASADMMFTKLSLSTSILWTLCLSITLEITKAYSCGYSIPRPSVGVKVIGSYQNLSWFAATKTWSPTLVLLFLATSTLVVEPPSMIKISESVGPCCLTLSLSLSWDGSFFKNGMRYPWARSLSTSFIRALQSSVSCPLSLWSWQYFLENLRLGLGFKGRGYWSKFWPFRAV